MRATYIDYSDTQSFSQTLLAYLESDKQLKEFYGNNPSYQGFYEQIKRKTGFDLAQRELLAERLQSQYGSLLTSSPAVAANIEALRQSNTFTVTTGHQLNIFTGPLYFIFKIVSAIRLAKDLAQEFPDKKFVPVYWMATEDHDFEEINHTRLYGKKICWDIPTEAATGRMMTGSMEGVVRQYCSMLGLSDNSEHLAQMVESSYLPDRPLAEATRTLVHQLFEKYGLIIVDADDRNLKKVFAPFMFRDITEGISFQEVTSSSVALEGLGHKGQVHAREINFFYLTDEVRNRIVPTNGERFEVLGLDMSWTRDELKEEIDRFPERFSPNVITRPLYQELILPNLAYIGGGAEIAYWLQLKAMFDRHGLTFPILVPRNSAMITDDQTTSKIFRLDLTFKSMFRTEQQLKNEFVRRNTKHRLNLKDEWLELNGVFGKIKLRAHKIDPSLGPSTDAVKARLKKAINNLEKKLLRAEKRNHSEALIQIGRVKEKLFPDGVLQERTENFAVFYIKHGEQLIEELIDKFHPLDFKFTIIH